MQIDTVIEPFISQRALRRAFCGEEPFEVGAALDAGHVVILDVDLGKYDAAARLVYLLAFEQLRLHMLKRIGRIEDGAVLNPVAFVSDEYAEVAIREHKRMWRLCREACIAPIIAYQLQSDLQDTVGSHDAADALVAGFATKVIFRTDDEASVSVVSRGLGKAEVERTSRTTSQGSNQGWSGGGVGASGQSGGENWSESEATAMQERSVVDAQLVQALRSDIRREIPVEAQVAEALVITNVGGKRVADVCEVRAWDPPRTSSHLEEI